MANPIGRAFDASLAQGSDRILGSSIAMNYQAAAAGQDPSYAEKANKLKSFESNLSKVANIFETWGQKKQAEDEQSGKQRADYLLNHFTPDQLAAARKQGKLLYQDDPYAMQSLNQKIGNTVALNVDNAISQNIQSGKYKSRKELDEARAAMMNTEGKKWADTYGADWDNPEFQIGLNSQAEQRNITLYSQHDTYMDSFHKGQAELQHRADANSLYGDSRVLKDLNAPQLILANLETQRKAGGWDDLTADKTLKQDIADIAQRDGGLDFLNNAENAQVTYNGKSMKLKDMFTEEQWNGMKLEAAGATFKLDAKKAEEFNNQLAAIQYNPDTNLAEAQLAKLKASLNNAQPTAMLTAQREQIIQAEQAMIARRAQENAQRAKKLQEMQTQAANVQILDNNFMRAANGEQVPTDYSMILGADNKSIPKEDAVAFAQMKIKQINGMDVPQEQKDTMLLKMMSLEPKDGAIRAYYSNTLSQASAEWSRMVAAGQDTGEHPAIDQMLSLYRTNHQVVTSVFPDQMGMLTRLDEFSQAGISLGDMLVAEKLTAATKNDYNLRTQLENDWRVIVDNSAGKRGDIFNTDVKTREAAHQVFLAQRSLGKSSGSAGRSAMKFIEDNSVVFNGDDSDEGTSFGTLPKASLMVTDDPASYSTGEQYMKDILKEVQTANPDLVGHLAVEQESTSGDILIRSPLEGFTYRLTPQMLKDHHAAVIKQAHDEAVKAAKGQAKQPLKAFESSGKLPWWK